MTDHAEPQCIRPRRYKEIDSEYQLKAGELTRRVVIALPFVILIFGVWLLYRTFGSELHPVWFVGALIVLLLLGYGAARHPANRRAWPTLLANRQSVFLLASTTGDEFLEVPWRYIEDFHAGVYGLNVRGIQFSIPKDRLSEHDQRELRGLSSVLDRRKRLVVAIPSGLRRRSRVLEALRALSPASAALEAAS